MALSKEQKIRMLQLRIQIKKKKLALAKAREMGAEGTIAEPTETSPAEQLRQQALSGTLTPEMGNELVAQDEAMNEDPRIKSAKAQIAEPQAMEEHARNLVAEREARVGTEAETGKDTISRWLFGKDAATPLEAIEGASTIGMRGLGAIAQQGDFVDNDTMLLKGFKEDLTDWASSREAQNATADSMIENLQNALDNSTNLPPDMIEGMQTQINELEESKNSGFLTSAVDIIGGISLDVGSDPAAWKNFIKGAIKLGKKPFKKGLKYMAEGVMDKNAQVMERFGIKDNRMLEYIDGLEGRTVREKLRNMRRGQKGELSATGQIQNESIEAMFDERTVKQLEENADAIQAELDRVKDVGKDVQANIASKKQSAKEAVDTERKTGMLEAEIGGMQKQAKMEAGAQSAIDAIPQDVIPEEVVGEAINKGRLAGKGKNVGFNEAEKIERATSVSAEDQVRLIEEALVASEGGRTKGVDFSSKADRIWGKIGKDASSADVAKVLKQEGADAKTTDTIKRIIRGDIKELRVAKEEFDTILAKGGDLTGTAKENATTVKDAFDEVIEGSAGINLGKLRKAQTSGGEEKLALNSLYEAMDVPPSKATITGETINKGKAVDALNTFFDAEAKKFADNGFKPTTEMKQGGKFSEWKKYLGIDVKKEINNRARKLALASEVKTKVKEIAIDTKKAQKAISESSGDAMKKIDKMSKKSATQLKNGILRRTREIDKALKAAKSELGAKANVASDFKKMVSHFASEGGFSKNTETFKAFKRKYGEKLADMVEDQAIFDVFSVSPSGKIDNPNDLLTSFKHVRVSGALAHAGAFGETVVNKVYNTFKPYESRLNKAINKMKGRNAELAKELNKVKKKAQKAGEEGVTKEIFDRLAEKNPLMLSDILSSEFKFFDPLTLMDKATIMSIANSTGREYTNRERMMAKRLIARSKKKQK